MPNPIQQNRLNDSGNKYFYRRILHREYCYHTYAKSNPMTPAESNCRLTANESYTANADNDNTTKSNPMMPLSPPNTTPPTKLSAPTPYKQ
mmetsp:Transcript_41824/g.75326  ORF Transcript_41824/g.75326 Transcript_41824/m.75326 type:complete len:91 (+) Transcript_41824:279-551(+)